jgi:hypothetical protein
MKTLKSHIFFIPVPHIVGEKYQREVVTTEMVPCFHRDDLETKDFARRVTALEIFENPSTLNVEH